VFVYYRYKSKAYANNVVGHAVVM